MMLYELAHRCQVSSSFPTASASNLVDLTLPLSFPRNFLLPMKGVSGRTLRRLPVIAHAHYINHHTRSDGRPHGTRKWLEAMNLALEANTFAMDKVEGRE